MTMRSAAPRIAGLAIGLALAACTSGGAPKPSAGSSSPPQPATSSGSATEALSAGDILAVAAKAAAAKGFVHTVATLKQGKESARVVNDTGTPNGRQVIIAGKQHTEILLVDEIAYLRANEEALTDFLGFPPDEASTYADKWLSFTISDAGYGELVETLDMTSLIENITLTGELTKTAVTTIDGRRAIGIKGEHPQGGTGTLYVAADGEPLPVRMEIADQNASSGSLVFSDWGKKVSVKAPSGATPMSDVITA
jgi:hypothetical protein